MVAFHFPPLSGGSGIQRTLRLVQHLPSFGWQPLVLSVHPRAYQETASDLMAEVPPDVIVRRAFALDSARHLSIRGRYFGWTARPDRWVTWKPCAVLAGLRMIDQFKPNLIWSTYPIATAHSIGLTLHRRSGIPWVADFRDPMAQPGYPSDSTVWRSFKEIEANTLREAACCVFTTPGAARMYRSRYPLASGRIAVVENGYDEESFSSCNNGSRAAEPLIPGKLTLLHSGIVYPSERDPTALFRALQRLIASGRLRRQDVCIRFRAPLHSELLANLAAQHGVVDCIEIVPQLAYREALNEMLRADGLLLMQASNCNEQIPAKLYEYLRAGRPIIALTDPTGDTAATVRAAGLDAVARLDSEDEIVASLSGFLDALRQCKAALPDAEFVRRASRRVRSQQQAELFDLAIAGDGRFS